MTELSFIEELGREDIEKALASVGDDTLQLRTSEVEHGSVLEAILAEPIGPLVAQVMGWEFDGKNFHDPGSRENKGCFVPEDANVLIHCGTPHISGARQGYSPFTFIREQLHFSNRETYAWFEEHRTHIRALAEKELEAWKKEKSSQQSQKDGIKSNPDSRFHYSTKRESEKITFVLKSMGALLEEPEESHSWVVQDMLPTSGVSILVAKPKVGKSTEARNLALCVARGTQYLGRETTKGKVIYLALEEKRSEVQRHFANMGATKEDLIFVHVGAAPENAILVLQELIKEHKPILVIIDPLFLLIRVEDANDYAKMTRALAPLRDIARDGDCHILTTHHHTKMDRSGGDGILGSTAIFGAVDTAIIMKKREGGQRVIQSSQRYGVDLPETVVSLNVDSGQTTVAGELRTI